jgi:hypothetical protein
MCFSSSASFGMAALLTVIGALTLYKTKRREQLMLSLIPLMFAVQQITEGIVWLSLQNSTYASLQSLATYLFLTFAYIVWPFWIPLSLLLLEKNKEKRKIMTACSYLGALISLSLGGMLILYGKTAAISGNSIIYNWHTHFSISWHTNFFIRGASLIYAIPLIVPFFISSLPYFRFFGLIITFSLLLSHAVWYYALTSVWCFFAALLSSMLIFFVDQQKKA